MVAFSLVLAVAAAALAAAAAPTEALQAYNSSATLEEPVAVLHWTLNDTSVQMALVITDPAVVTATASTLWLGIGVGEPTSGGMLGADIVTGEFATAGATTCRLVDRHVPQVAYPLGSTAGGGEGVFPVEDDCGTVPTWALVACTIEPETGTMTLEVTRDLAAGDPAQDRDIVAGRNILLFSYGDGFGYHGPRRRSVAVDLTKTGPQATGDRGLEEDGRLPPDVVASQLLTIPNYPIPTNRTEYACMSFTADLPTNLTTGGRRQVVAAEAVIDKTSVAGKMVHHFLIFSCPASAGGLWEKFKDTPGTCFDEQLACNDVLWVYVDTSRVVGRGELPRRWVLGVTRASCESTRANWLCCWCFVTVLGVLGPFLVDRRRWAAGADPLVMPSVAGFPVTEEERFYVMQVRELFLINEDKVMNGKWSPATLVGIALHWFGTDHHVLWPWVALDCLSLPAVSFCLRPPLPLLPHRCTTITQLASRGPWTTHPCAFSTRIPPGSMMREP